MNKYLFDELEKNYLSSKKTIFRASNYWQKKNNFIIKKIKSEKSIDNFRSNNSNLSSGFSDNMIVDFRLEYNLKYYQKIISSFLKIFPFKNIFNSQVNLTKKYFSYLSHFRDLFFEKNENVNFLIQKFNFDGSVNFGCDNFVKIKNNKISVHHLNLAYRHFQISKNINFETINTHCEIGGGFGAYAEFLLKNFSNVKKFLYVDIFPQIFFGTVYLKKIFPENVIDYVDFKKRNFLFKDNEDLEIVILPPTELENINYNFDHFHNAFSFQEMELDQIRFYKDFIVSNSKKNTNYSFVFYPEESNESLDIKQFEIIYTDINLNKLSFTSLNGISEEILFLK